MNECCDVPRSSFRIIVPIFPAPCSTLWKLPYDEMNPLPNVRTPSQGQHTSNECQSTNACHCSLSQDTSEEPSHLQNSPYDWLGVLLTLPQSWISSVQFCFFFPTWLKVLFLKILPNKPLVSQFLLTVYFLVTVCRQQYSHHPQYRSI